MHKLLRTFLSDTFVQLFATCWTPLCEKNACTWPFQPARFYYIRDNHCFHRYLFFAEYSTLQIGAIWKCEWNESIQSSFFQRHSNRRTTPRAARSLP